jgi:thiol-disulfide isomerase/thioredoxin
MQLVLEQTPTFEICAVGSGKIALMVLCRPLANDWFVFRTWYNRLSKIDKLYVSILLVNAAEFNKSITLSKAAISMLRNEILKYHENLNSAEADVLIAMKHKLSLSGKGINSMFGETRLSSVTGLDISAVKLQPKGSDSAVLYFWATWCGPCIAFIKTYLANQAAKPKYIFISLDADEDKWKKMSQELGLPDEINLQMRRPFIESFRKNFNIESLPAKFIITKKGFQF